MSELRIIVIENQKKGGGIIEISGPIAFKEPFKSLSLEYSRGYQKKQSDDGWSIENIPDDDVCTTMVFEKRKENSNVETTEPQNNEAADGNESRNENRLVDGDAGQSSGTGRQDNRGT